MILTNEYFISELNADDTHSHIKYLNDKEITDNLLTIPFPYTEADAVLWIQQVENETKFIGKPAHFAIRNQSGELIGGIGLRSSCPSQGELGYWLAKSYWGQGIMTKAVIRLCEYGFQELNFVRIIAKLFDFNQRSETVLKNAGFEFEMRVTHQYFKNEQYFDGLIYAKTRKDN